MTENLIIETFDSWIKSKKIGYVSMKAYYKKEKEYSKDRIANIKHRAKREIEQEKRNLAKNKPIKLILNQTEYEQYVETEKRHAQERGWMTTIQAREGYNHLRALS